MLQTLHEKKSGMLFCRSFPVDTESELSEER